MKSIVKLLGISILVMTLLTPILSQPVQSAPPPEPVTEYFYSDKAVYVYEEQSTTNFDSGLNRYYLYSGESYEFLYDYLAFVEFSSINLPEDAEIQEAEIGLYLRSTPENVPVKMYYIRENWVENTVTWNTKPSYKNLFSKYTGLVDTITISSSGWQYWDATNLVEDWIDGTKTNYGVAFESREGEYHQFYSDDSSYYKPRLRITYLSSTGDDPEEPPEEPPEDNTPCSISYTITPDNPQSGDTVTIDVTATDDTAMEYISIYKGGVEVETCNAEGTQTLLTCSYSEILYTPGASFSIFADDQGLADPQGETFTVEVEGSGTSPEVSIDIEFRDENAIPESHRLLPGDNQMINITVTATDPDGINFLTIDTSTSIPQDYTFDPPETTVTRTLTVLNDDITDREFTFYARAYDTEESSTRVDGEPIEIDVPYQWYWGLPFANWGCDENHTWGWDMMESIYGEDEVWLDKGYGWKRPRAERLYEHKVEEGGQNGQCWGMCLLSLELAKPGSGLYANYIQDNATNIDGLERENWNYTWRYYYARQAGQYSKEKQDEQSDQYWDQNGLSTTTSSGLHPHLENILDDIIDDLEDGNPGILGIRGTGGHAVVPWRVLPGEGDRPTRIYIYDPNRPHASTHDSIDYSNTNHYPFIEVGVDSSLDGWWSYVWNSTSTWDGNIYYYSYDTAIGNPSEKNYIGYAEITDQRLPSSTQITAMGSGDATFYATDSSGRLTGFVNGEVITEIPYSYPIVEFAGNSNEQVIFVYPNNITLDFSIESQIKSDDAMGFYSFVLMDNASLYSLNNASCTKSTVDEILFTPRPSNAKTQDYSFRFKRGDVTKIRFLDPMDYTISIAKEFYNSPKPVVREYHFTSNQNNNGAEVELSISDDYDDLIIETYDTAFNFTVETKSTESLEDNPDLSYIPSSKETLSIDANDKMVLTPNNWATSSATGSFTTDDDTQSDDTPQTPGFEVIFILIALIGVILWKKR